MPHPLALPPGITLLERGWLSSNNILICGQRHCALVDSGYASHAAQTLALVTARLGQRALDVLANTHLHSDHCGGNAALQARYPALQTLIPPGQAKDVADWDPAALTYHPTGQQCERFTFSGTLQPGTELDLGDQRWQLHAAPGHDPHSVLLFEPATRLLLSADALWHNGFGVVFPELDGSDAFDDVARTLDLIESFQPRLVIPGHGGAFSDVSAALARARSRLDGFVKNPAKHRRHAAKVMVKFKLLEVQRLEWRDLLAWAEATELLLNLNRQDGATGHFEGWLSALVDELAASGALTRELTVVINQS